MKKLDTKTLKTVSGGTFCGGISVGVGIGFGGGCKDSCGSKKSSKC